MERFEEMLGRTITEIVVDKPYDDKITFTFDDGSTAWLYHSQDCCESVRIEEIHGDLDDLVGAPLLLVEEVTLDDGVPDDEGRTGSNDCWAWTFYKLATVKGYVTLRWLGESNGYYGIGVDFGWSA